jgi:spore germination protein GerM
MMLMMLVFVGAAIVGRRQRRHAAPVASSSDEYRPATAASGADPFARAAEVGLAEIEDLSREPREAIIACYAAMERELENSPEVIPRESDTPSEVLARAVEHHALGADTATGLVDLFEEARFSSHVMTEEHRETAVRVLTLVLAELRSVG